MGLDSFKTDDTQDSDSDSQEQSENVEEEEQTEDEHNDKLSGLDAFRTKETDPSQEDEDTDFIFGVKPWRWNDMSTDEKVKHVRDNYIEDYRPDYQIDDRWSYNTVTEIECVCGNDFTFQAAGICMGCGRVYKRTERTVVKVQEVELDNSETDT